MFLFHLCSYFLKSAPYLPGVIAAKPVELGLELARNVASVFVRNYQIVDKPIPIVCHRLRELYGVVEIAHEIPRGDLSGFARRHRQAIISVFGLSWIIRIFIGGISARRYPIQPLYALLFGNKSYTVEILRYRIV